MSARAAAYQARLARRFILTHTYPSSTSPEALHRLLAVSHDLHALNRLSRQLCAGRFSEDAAQPVPQRAWTTLCEATSFGGGSLLTPVLEGGRKEGGLEG